MAGHRALLLLAALCWHSSVRAVRPLGDGGLEGLSDVGEAQERAISAMLEVNNLARQLGRMSVRMLALYTKRAQQEGQDGAQPLPAAVWRPRGAAVGAAALDAAAAAPKYTRAAAIAADVDTNLVGSAQISLKGHTLTVVTMKNDEVVGDTILRKKRPFQEGLLSQLMDFITPGSTVVDAGANFGSLSVFFAAAAGPNGAVYSFEPQARMFQLLCTNMMVNGLLQMRPKNMALSHAPGVLHMSATVPDGRHKGKAYDQLDGASNATINYGGMRLGKSGEEVRAITLDSLGLENVSVMKVDVQGAERLMFYGARDTIRRNKPVITYESLDTAGLANGVAADLELPEDVRNFDIGTFLKELGYTESPAHEYFTRTGDAILLPPGHSFLSSPQHLAAVEAAARKPSRRRGLLGGL